jgi:MOFRL family
MLMLGCTLPEHTALQHHSQTVQPEPFRRDSALNQAFSPEENAGAWFDHGSPPPDVPTLDASAFLANNDAYGYFSGLNQLVMTGPMLANVNDFRAMLIR